MKKYKNSIIRGTLILMLAGLLTRFLGFYYRIFLSARIGAEGMGLYQMIFPLYGLCMSISVSGVQTAISKFVSGSEKHSLRTLAAGLCISVPLSLLCSFLMAVGSDAIAEIYLNEPRCSLLLKYSAIALPMSVIHNCISGYFLGKKNATVPGLTQFLEQVARVGAIWLVFYVVEDKFSGDMEAFAIIAVIGLIVGEFVSMLVSVIATLVERPISKLTLNRSCPATTTKQKRLPVSPASVMAFIKPVAMTALPLTLTSVIMGIVHSLEATAIPYFLNRYGLSYGDAISLYGVLTAMAMPFIMFPTTVSGAVSRMLLPTISAAQAENNTERIASLSMKTLKYSVALGIFCTCFFILTGDYIGKIIYDNETAGDFITILAWLCPLMFTSGTLGSILHGLGLTKITFYQNMASSCLRLCFTIFAIPVYGIKGYLWGILASELLCAVLHTGSVLRYIDRFADL